MNSLFFRTTLVTRLCMLRCSMFSDLLKAINPAKCCRLIRQSFPECCRILAKFKRISNLGSTFCKKIRLVLCSKLPVSCEKSYGAKPHPRLESVRWFAVPRVWPGSRRRTSLSARRGMTELSKSLAFRAGCPVARSFQDLRGLQMRCNIAWYCMYM